MAACAVCSNTVSASPVSVVGSSGRCQGPSVPWLGLGRRRVAASSLLTPWAAANTRGETAIQRHTAWDSASASSLGSCSFGRSFPLLGSSSSGGGGGLPSVLSGDRIGRGRRGVVCEVAVSVGDEQSSGEKDQQEGIKAGDRVRVKAPITVYHVPKAKNLKIEGLVGEVKEVLGIYKGKPISATFPIKAQFFIDVDEKEVKFFAHLKAEECEIVKE